MKGLVLTDLIDVGLLQRFQDEFSRYTGMAALITDADGKPVTIGSGFTEFCMNYTRKSPLGCERCEQCDKNGALTALATGKPMVYTCHAGLADFASPIMVGNKLVGCCLGGQVRIDETDKEKLKETAKELGIDFEEYYEAAQKISRIDEKELHKAAEFLGLMANVLSEMAYQNYTAINKYRKLERAARSQSHFLIDLSTDLHENMTKWIKTLEEGVKSGNKEAITEVIDTMLYNGTATHAIIGDIVKYMKYSDGNVELYETSYHIRDVVRTAVELEEEDAAQKRIKVTYNVGNEVPETLYGDAGRIGQILSKLIVNAIAGKENVEIDTEVGIFVSSRTVSYANWLTIEVRNTEKGMAIGELETMREYFSRGALKLQDREEYSDFALSIVDLFIRQMQGEMRIESNDGKNTVFIIELPQLKMEEKQGGR